ncbi:MAG: hypothetical protein JWO58_2221 [Chitinophagaceae bacterium]|nr:hypothetical protein [Chitinophagaceae bacterium]
MSQQSFTLKEYNITNRSFFSIGPHLLGLIFIAIGMFTIASPLFMPGDNSILKAVLAGTAAVVFGLMVIASYSGTLFDFVEKRYKKYYSLSGFQIGQWEPLPVVRLIKVFPYTFRVTTTSNGINPSANLRVTRYNMALYTHQHKPFMVFEHDNMDRTMKDAKVLSEQLKVVLDMQLSKTP